MTEKGNNVKIRRELEQANANHKEVVVELEALRKELVKVTSKTDAVERDEAFWKMEMEKLTADMKIIKLERDRLVRELDDFQAKEATLLDQLKVIQELNSLFLNFSFEPGASFQLFLGGPTFFLFFNATGLLKNWKKQHFICSNLTLFIVPFFLFSLFFSFLSLFSFFSFFFLFFLFFFFLGGRRPQPPQMTPLI